MQPVLFSIGDTPIHAYGFFIALALLLGWVLSLKFARDDKLPADQLGMAYVLSVALGLLGGRLMWLTQNRPASLDETLGALLQLEAGGISGFGGVLIGLIVATLYCQNQKVKIPTWAWLDCVAPAFLFGMVLERVGAFMAGAEFGHYADPNLFLAVQFPSDSLVYQVQRRDLTGLRIGPDLSLTVHPSQLYAAAAALLGTVIAFVVRARRRYSGQTALFVLGYFALVRYVIEDPFRYDATPEVVGPLSLGMITGLVVVGVAWATHASRLGTLAETPADAVQWTGGMWTPGAAEAAKKAAKKASKKSSAAKPDTEAADTASDKSASDKTEG